MQKDLTRALLALATHGTAGQTPYVLADAVRLVQLQGLQAHIVHVDARLETVHFLVIGRNIYVRFVHHGERIEAQLWTDGIPGWLRADVSVKLSVPDVYRIVETGTLVRVEDVILDWTKQWPDVAIVASAAPLTERCIAYVSSLQQCTTPCDLFAAKDRVFLDERELSCAIVTLVRIAVGA